MSTSTDFFMPAEWHSHDCCWMGWPCRPQSWPFPLERAQAAYARVANAIADFEKVKLLVHPQYLASAQQHCGTHPNISLISMPMNDAWLRDTGATFVMSKQQDIKGISWGFNGWGGSHSDVEDDAALAERLLSHSNISVEHIPLVLEGGSIHVDGAGTLLTTEECLLHPSRNPELTKAEISQQLQQVLGIKKIIWLGQGLADDETAGHVDNIACFAREGVVIALTTEDKQDSNYQALQDNLQRLRAATDAQGRKLEVITIAQPAYRHDPYLNHRMALSYINYYMANNAIIVPIFNDPADAAALATLATVFPNREIVGVEALDIVYGGGCIHCITQQQPVMEL